MNFFHSDTILKNCFLVFLGVPLLLSCGGSNSDQPSSSEPSDEQVEENKPEPIYWYFSDRNHFLSVETGGNVRLLSCSINNGYIEDDYFSGSKIGNSLEYSFDGINYYTFEVDKDNNLIKIKDFSREYEVFQKLPLSCDDSAIEITGFTPEESFEGLETTYVILFDYRLKENEAIIRVGFPSDGNGSYATKSEDSLVLKRSGLGSGSLTVSHSPEVFDASLPYYIYLNMSPTVVDGSYIPYATDKELTAVIPEN